MMSIPPIEPTNPAYGQAKAEIPVRDRVHNDLLSMQQTHAQLQTALASNDNNLSHIDSLLQLLHLPIQDLLQIASQKPPVLSQNEIDVVNAIQTQYQSIQANPGSASPSIVAALQGNSNTLDQMFAAEVAGIPEPNVHALQAQNHLSYLSNALQLHVKTHRMRSAESEAIINSMQNPMKELSHLFELGILTPSQSDAVIDVRNKYTTTIQVTERINPEAISEFQSSLQNLNNLLTT